MRKRAAAALRTLGATDALPALKSALDKEQDPETRSNIVAALAALELEKDRSDDELKVAPVQQSEFDALIQQLSSPQPEKIITAAMKLGEMRDKRAVEPLVMLFNNSRIPVTVRLSIAEALLKLESAPVEVALLGALRSSKWKVRRNGAAILGKVRADWAVTPLVKALDDENDIVRKTARAALRHINSPEARAALGITEPTSSHKTDTLSRPPKPVPPPAESVSTPSTPAPPNPAIVEPSVAAPADTPTQSQRPDAKLVWPKRELPPEEDQSKIPTRPLDPKRLEEAEDRLNGHKPGDG